MSVAIDSVEDMHGATALVGIAGVTAGIAGGAAGMRATQPISEWANQVRAADVQLLETGKALPLLPEPEDSPVRHPRKRWLIYVASILIGALTVALLGALAASLITHGVSTSVPEADMLPGERVLALVLTGLVGGGVGFLIGAVLGIPLGGVLDILEIRRRLKAAQPALKRMVWERRETLRSDLAAGHITPLAAISQLQADIDY